MARRRPRTTSRPPRPRLTLEQARAALREQADRRCGVLYRPDVVAAGVPRWVLQAELRSRRWQRSGRQTVVTHNGPLDDRTRRVIAVLEVGPRAALDGVSALQHDGVAVADDGSVHVIAPKSSNPRHPPGVRVHESRRFDERHVVEREGVRVVLPAVAAVHAALWARTDAEAELFPVLVVQQRRCTPGDVFDALLPVRRAARKTLLFSLALELAGGVRSLGELQVARALRSRGLPEPDRQVVRLRPSGTQYLDCRFEHFDVTLEIDGAQHEELEAQVADLLRDWGLVAEGDAVLRLPLVVWRVAREQVLDALERVFTARGWYRPAA